MMFRKLVSVGFRAAALGGKLVALILFSRFLSVEEYAIFGIMYAFVAYFVYAASFNFYAFSIRSVVKGEIEFSRALLNHILVVFVIFAFVSFAAILFLREEALYGKYLVFLGIIFALEQMSHELYHFLIAARRQLAAGFAFFFKGWVLAA